MDRAKIFILAQGEGSRWIPENWGRIPPAPYKQVVPFNDKDTIISRTIKQVMGQDITVICHGDIIDYIKGLPISVDSFRDPGTILKGIWLTNFHYDWQKYDRIIFLLGDVVFSNECIKKILNDEEFLSIYGRRGANPITGKEAREIFAFSVCKMNYVPVISVLYLLWKRDKKSKLWDFYREYVKHHFIEIDDFTDDLDSPEEYDQFWPKLVEAAANDDAKL